VHALALNSSNYLLIFFRYAEPSNQGEWISIMDMHAIAGVAVLLVLVAASAYRDALRNDPLNPFRKRGAHRSPASHSDEAE
jgi:cytochrome b561